MATVVIITAAAALVAKRKNWLGITTLCGCWNLPNGVDFEGRASMRIQQQPSTTSLPPLEYRNHTTLLFEHLPYNLRETLAKFGKNVGINLTAVRSYSRQLFRALAHLAKHRVVHADIKPDNILVSADFSTVKLCDFGSAFFETDKVHALPGIPILSRTGNFIGVGLRPRGRSLVCCGNLGGAVHRIGSLPRSNQ